MSVFRNTAKFSPVEIYGRSKCVYCLIAPKMDTVSISKPRQFLRHYTGQNFRESYSSYKYVQADRRTERTQNEPLTVVCWVNIKSVHIENREIKLVIVQMLHNRPALGPIQPPIQWAPGVHSRRVKRSRGVTLTTHPHLTPRSRMHRSYIPLPLGAYMASSGTAFTLLFTSVFIYQN
jgi:glutaredoxin